MDATDLAFTGIAEQARLIAAGEISSRELVQLYLDRTARFDSQLNAFRVLFAERALTEASQADARRGAGGQRPLLGVPIAVKDDIDVAGEVTALGSNAYGEPTAQDAEVVARLRRAGAIVIGKTNVPELCIWPFTETVTWGSTRNPWDPQRTPGGSSGGSGAAVAAGLVGGALGSDGAGSIRIPSAWCGLLGLKPERGRVPMAPHLSAWHGLSVNGLLGRTVADTALFLDVVAGPGSTPEADAPPLPSEPFARALDAPSQSPRLRIACSTKVPTGIFSKLDADAARAYHDTIELLRSLGHVVEQQDPDYGIETLAHVLTRMLTGTAVEAASLPHPARLERRTRTLARIGALLPEAALRWSQQHEAQLRERLGRVLASHDVLLTPAVAQPPSPIGEYQARGGVLTLNAVASRVPYNAPWNVTGQPACSVPAGLGADGLPRAVQLVGRPRDEATLLALAAELEAARPWAQQRPPQFA
ncbi:MAG: amidase [Solirubrobacteraceae bacterium]